MYINVPMYSIRGYQKSLIWWTFHRSLSWYGDLLYAYYMIQLCSFNTKWCTFVHSWNKTDGWFSLELSQVFRIRILLWATTRIYKTELQLSFFSCVCACVFGVLSAAVSFCAAKNKMSSTTSSKVIVCPTPSEFLPCLQSCVEQSSKDDMPLFLLFTGEKVNPSGKSWCPDCVVSEPIILSSLSCLKGKHILMECIVKRDEYKVYVCIFLYEQSQILSNNN